MDITREQIFETWSQFAQTLDGRSLQYFFVGGLAVRMVAAQSCSRKLTVNDLRDHSDIDIIVFEEDLIDFLRLFAMSRFHVWHAAKVGLTGGYDGEHHHVSIKDQETGVVLGLFVARRIPNGRMIRTNLFDNICPDAIFEYGPIVVNSLRLNVVAPEWLYYNSIMRTGEKKRDAQLVWPYVDLVKFNTIQDQAYKVPMVRSEYVGFVEWLDGEF